MEHQDWNVVILKKKKKKKNVKNIGGNCEFRKVDNATSSDKIKLIGRKQGLVIQQYRLKKKMTRKELARTANIPLDTVTKFELGTALKKDVKRLNLLKRILGIQKNRK